MRKPALGRGLNALIGDSESIQRDATPYQTIPIAEIKPGRTQTRQYFDPQAIDELEQSIRKQGVLQPILVRPVDKGYEIIAGERRFRAASQAGLDTMPCIVRDMDDNEATVVGLIENIKRKDLNPLEIAEGFLRLIEEFTLTHDSLAQAVGYSRSSVTNTLRLLKLSAQSKEQLLNETIDMGHARALLALEDERQQNAVLQKIIEEGWTVRKTEQYIRNLLRPAPPEPADEQLHQDSKRLEEHIHHQLGWRVQIKASPKGSGKIILDYKDLDDLDRILQQWGIDSKEF